MSFPQNYVGQGGYHGNDMQPTFHRKSNNNSHHQHHHQHHQHHHQHHNHNYYPQQEFSQKARDHIYNGSNASAAPCLKRRKVSGSNWENNGVHYQQVDTTPSATSLPAPPTRPVENSCSTGSKRDREDFEEEVPFMSRDEIERLSPSRKDGIDSLRETYLRYSYCAFLQNLGMRLELPQTTIGTAMVLCHRFFVRQSHACHDRFLISTAALFLAAKSEETPCPLNNILKASCEICHKQGFNFFPSLLPVDWFQQYRERVIEAEEKLLTTLDFELNVQHPYVPLTSVLNKLGLSETVLVNLALSLVSEGLRSSLWLQFKPHHIAAGAAFLAAKFLNLDLAAHQRMWQEFQTSPSILQDVVQQLMELF